MSAPASLLERLLDRLEEVGGDHPEQVATKAKTCLLHALGCAYGGRELEWSKVTTSLAYEAGDGPGLVWLVGRRRPLLSAVYSNAAASQATLAEDVHAESATHPGAVVVPAALAVAEMVGAGGPELLEAIVVGYEAMAQVGRIALTSDFQQRGFRPTGVVGPLGSAAAAARLLNLDRRGTGNALALAVNGSGGLVEWNLAGTMEAGFQTGAAARNGVEAALLAAQGCAGAPSILDGRAGLLQAFSGGQELVDEGWPLAGAPEIERVYVKHFGHCVFGQETIEAARRVSAEGVVAADVESVEVAAYRMVKEYPGLDNPGPYKGAGECVASGQFAVAAVLLDGGFTSDRYRDPADPELNRLAARVSISIDPEAERRYPETKVSSVRIRRRDGSTVEGRVEGLDPPDAAAVEQRFRLAAEPVLGPGAERVIDAIAGIDRADSLEELIAPMLAVNAGC
jgi:2-methylcitrate dehydratase PrpD